MGKKYVIVAGDVKVGAVPNQVSDESFSVCFDSKILPFLFHLKSYTN